MKKVSFLVLFILGLIGANYAQSIVDSTNVNPVVKEISEISKQTSSGTTYGVTQITQNDITVKTPIGTYTVTKGQDGYYSVLGIKAKAVKRSNNKYAIKSNIGDWEIDVNKMTITKK